jgi:hypothetical protein
VKTIHKDMNHHGLIDGWDLVLGFALTVKWAMIFITDLPEGYHIATGAISVIILLIGGWAKIEQIRYYRSKGKRGKEG